MSAIVRQARSELTRRKILRAAIDLFSAQGYSATGLGDIIDEAELTKGALYYHFDSKEALGATIIAEADARILEEFENIAQSASPALENLIHGTFAVSDFIAVDRHARVGLQLLRTFGGFNATARQIYQKWHENTSTQIKAAISEGDVRAEAETSAVTDVILSTLLGSELLAHAGVGDQREHITGMWQLLLPTVVDEDALEYFGQFLARESLRGTPLPPRG